MKKRYYILFIFLVLFTSVFVWRKPLTFQVVKFGFKYFTEKSLGEKVSFHDFEHERGLITLLEPKIGSKNKAVEKGGFFLEAESASLKYDVDWLSKSIKVNLSLKKPKIELIKTADFKPSLAHLFSGKEGFFSLETSIEVIDGELDLIDKSSRSEVLREHIQFEVGTEFVSQTQTAFRIAFQQGISKCTSFVNIKEKQVDYKIELEDVQMARLQNALYFWTSHKLKEERSLNCSKGKLSGSVDLSIKENYLPAFETHLEVENLHLSDKKTLLSTIVPKAEVNLVVKDLIKEKKEYSLIEVLETLIESTTGLIEIPNGAEILYQKNELEILKSPDMKGEIRLKNGEPTALHLEGDVAHGDYQSHLIVEGTGFLTMLKGDLEIKMQRNFNQVAKLRCSLDPYGIDQHKVYAQMINFSHHETEFIQQLLMPFYPEIKSMEVKNGLFAASFQCLFKNYRLKEIVVDDFSLKKGQISGLQWAHEIENIDADGSFSVSFENNEKLKTLNGMTHFKIEKLLVKDYPIHKVEGECEIAQGHIEKGGATLSFANLDTSLKWDTENKEEPLDVSIKGLGADFIKFAPGYFKEQYAPIFSYDFVTVSFVGKTHLNELALTGNCKVGENEPAHFGFTLCKRNKKEDKKEQFRIFWENFIKPVKTTPALRYFEKSLSLNINSNIYVKEGWFECQSVAIEKFISPILFGETTIKFKGTSDVVGKFDQEGLSLSYNHYHLNFDHHYFSIDINSNDNVLGPGYHYFNFNKKTHFGRVFVEKAACSVKCANLNFKNLSGWVEITPDRIYAEKLKADVSDLSLTSELNLAFLGDGDLDLMLKISELKGELTDFKSLFGSLESSFFNNLPLEGNVEIEPKQAFFHLLKKEEVQTRIKLKGSLKNGSAPFMGGQPLSQVNCKFTYDSDSQIVEINDFESVWKSHRNQNYGLFFNYFKMNLFEDEPSLFDVKIKNSYQDCARLVGKLYLNLGQNKPILKIILDQKNNHIGSVGLTNVYFALNESFNLDYLSVNFSCNLASVNHDVSLIQNLFPKLSGSSITALKWMNLQGDLSGQWVFDLNQDQHQFFVWGDQIKIGETKGGFFQLKGHKKKNSFLIEDMTYQDLKGSCKVQERPFCFFIRDVKLASGEDLSVEMGGVYCKIFNSFQADITKLYCNLSKVKNLDLFSQVPFLQESAGSLDFKGKVEGGYFKGDMNYSLQFSGNTYGLKIQEVLFEDDKVYCSFKGNSKRFEVEHFESKFLEAFKKPIHASLIGHHLELKKNMLGSKIGDIQFAITADSLMPIQSLLKDKWCLNIPESSFEIKKEGLLEGHLSFDPNDKNHPFTLNLKEGRYFLLNQMLFLNSCKLDYGPAGLMIEVKGPIHNKPYWLQYKKENFKKDAFQISLYDQNPILNKVSHLDVDCLEKKGGVLIKNIRGAVAGLRFDFVHRPEKDTSKATVLMGQLQIQGDELIKRLSWDMSSKLEKFSFGKGYFLTGQLKLPKDNFKNFVFEGLFGGQDFDLLGFEFKSLSSSIQCSPEHFLIKDLKISDLSGELAIDKIDIIQNPLGYALSIPKIILKNFKPSLLHKSHQGRVKHKPLIIELLEVYNLKGNLSDISTLRAEGFFDFQKSPKKQASLLDIPVHLISKLGLDLTMLNPVEGKVMFEVKDQKILFTKLIDVYSHDKRCHFTLPKYPDISYMDFEGNLNIKIKMKQYVLLKITEPFMISVQGHYLAPRYSFMRKKVVVDVPERSSEKIPL